VLGYPLFSAFALVDLFDLCPFFEVTRSTNCWAFGAALANSPIGIALLLGGFPLASSIEPGCLLLAIAP
jgi:hypothetical protein